MDLKSELQESVAEARNAKATQDAWVTAARSEASNHQIKGGIWLILIIGFVLAIAGLFTTYLSFATNVVSTVLGWIGLENYTLYFCVAFIVIGGIMIFLHAKDMNEQNAYANKIESMSLAKFRHTYM